MTKLVVKKKKKLVRMHASAAAIDHPKPRDDFERVEFRKIEFQPSCEVAGPLVVELPQMALS
jgi:hypothetical protein